MNTYKKANKDKTMLEQIREYCDANGISAYELAKHLPLSQVALQGILNGTTSQPRLKNIQLIYDYLFEGKSNIVNEPASVYLTGYDKKVNEAKQEIEELEKKLKSNDPDLSEKAKEFIRNIISLKYEEINLILEAKLDKLKEDEELNN